MKIFCFGKDGQLARSLATVAPDDVEIQFAGSKQLDLSNDPDVLSALQRSRPDIVVNAAAYTSVDKAETETAAAYALNSEAPRSIAAATATLRIPMVHISTDYVFSGRGNKAWKPHDDTQPVSAYGQSKLEGEKAIAATTSRYVILRTSWLFSEFGSNFVKTMLRLGQQRSALSIVADQIGAPTSAVDLATATLEISRQVIANDTLFGIFHYCGRPETNWADFARKIFEIASMPVCVTNIASSEYPTPATRPMNSRLDFSATAETFGLEQPDWEIALRRVLRQLEENHEST